MKSYLFAPPKGSAGYHRTKPTAFTNPFICATLHYPANAINRHCSAFRNFALSIINIYNRTSLIVLSSIANPTSPTSQATKIYHHKYTYCTALPTCSRPHNLIHSSFLSNQVLTHDITSPKILFSSNIHLIPPFPPLPSHHARQCSLPARRHHQGSPGKTVAICRPGDLPPRGQSLRAHLLRPSRKRT